ncbi:MAG TPA: phosphatidylcholine/phosphatidylserine synthase [Phycisphaerae bacterium]|nr:phosphatidylcholine/phosphatidylserine synthase [Phycisphaerae bacterium]
MRIPRILILPSLCTLANALCGFGAITLMTRAVLGTPDAFPEAAKWAGYLVILAMVFDALDGRLARFARATSDFGGQLDSVADVVSFGVAPAFLMNRVVVECLGGAVPSVLLRVPWVCAAVYLGCTLIRLARFNVENVHEEEAHMVFKGLPSPAAAGALVSVVIVLADFMQEHAHEGTVRVLLWTLPILAALLGLLMVSSFRYSHLLNQFVRGRRPVSHLVMVVVGIALATVLKEVVLPVGFGAYALSGPAVGLYHRIRGRRTPKPSLTPSDEANDETPDDASEADHRPPDASPPGGDAQEP